jgi:hypothetical protein
MQTAGSNEADPLIEQWHGMDIEKTARGDGNYHIRECDHQAEFPMYLGHFEETSGGSMDVEPVLDETFDAQSSIRPCGETACSGIEL